MLHRLCGPPSIPLSFNLAAVLPRRCAYRVSYDTERLGRPTSSTHRLQRGLPGYLILFAPHAFAPQRQLRTRSAAFATGVLPNIYEFHLYTGNSTTPLPHSSPHVSNAAPRLSPGISHLTIRAAYAPFNAQSFRATLAPLRITAAAGTKLAGASSAGTVIIVPAERALQSEDLLHSRGIAGSGLRPLSNIPHCCLP